MRTSSCSLSFIIIISLLFLALLNFNSASDIEVQEWDADSLDYQNSFQRTNKEYCQEWNRTNEKLESLLEESKTLKSSLQELRAENTKHMAKDESVLQICELKVELEKMRCMSETSKRQNLHQQALNAAENLARVAQNETAWLMSERTRELEHHVSELKVMQVSAAEDISRRTTLQQTVETLQGNLSLRDEENKKMKSEIQEIKHKIATTMEGICNKVKKRDLIELDGSYYYFSNPKQNKLDWESAKNACRARGMELVTIEDLKEQQRIHSYLVQNQLNGAHWYIGASDSAKEGEFIWVSSGEPVHFTFWKPNEPNNLGGSENCALILGSLENGSWNDVSCSQTYSHICELNQLCAIVLDHYLL